MAKYRYYNTADKVIAVSTYAGKNVKGVAKCDPRDTFDLDKGKQLAAARCDAKVARKRVKRAKAQMLKAEKALAEASMQYEKMKNYFSDALIIQTAADITIKSIVKDM